MAEAATDAKMKSSSTKPPRPRLADMVETGLAKPGDVRVVRCVGEDVAKGTRRVTFGGS
jgi:hypothetical protein